MDITEVDKIRVKSQNIEQKVDRTKKRYMFQPPFSLLLVANSRGGKSTLIRKILMNDEWDMIPSKFHPENVFLIGPTINDDEGNEDMFDFLKKFPTFDSDQQIIDDVTKLDNLVNTKIEEQKELKKQKIERHILFVLDDCYGDVNFSNTSMWNKLAAKGRHWKISYIITTQSYKGIGNSMRRQSTHYGIWELNDATEIDSVCKEMRGLLSKKIFAEVLNCAMQQDYGFLFSCRLLPRKDRFSISMEQIVEIQDWMLA